MIKYVTNQYKTALLLVLIVLCAGCDEDTFLAEKPQDFLSPEIAYVTANDYQAALAGLYARVREDFITDGNSNRFPALAWSGTEMVYKHNQMGIRPDWGDPCCFPLIPFSFTKRCGVPLTGLYMMRT